MTDTTAVTIALIGAIGSVLASSISAIIGLLAHGKIASLEANTNSIKDELVKVTGESEFAKGLKQGQEEEKD